MMNTNRNEVAETILEQLGGNRARAMMGVKMALSDSDSLTLHIGTNAKRVSILVIRLDPSDTYTVQFWTGKGIRCRKLSEVSDVYADALVRVVEEGTGMYLSL